MNMQLGKNFAKQKLCSIHDLEWDITHHWTQNPDLEGPRPHVLLELWSIIFRQSLKNKHCSALSKIVTLVRFQPPRKNLTLIWGVNGVVVALHPQLCDLAKKCKTKVKEHLHFIVGQSHFWTCHPDPEGLGPYVFLEPWSINFTHA